MGSRSSYQLGASLLVFAASFLLLAVGNLFGVHWFDEAYHLYPAWRLNQGDTLYRDVFVLTPPLH